MPNGILTLDQFRNSGAIVRPRMGRSEVWLPGQIRPDQLADGVDLDANFGYPEGIRFIFDALLELVREFMRVGRNHNAVWSEWWGEWEDQLEGIPPEKTEGMLCELAHNVALEVQRTVLTNIKNTVLSGPFFQYEPPAWDSSDEAKDIAEAAESIARAQIERPDFEHETNAFDQYDVLYGYCVALAEHQKRLEPRRRNGRWEDVVTDRGTRFQSIRPTYTMYGKVNEPNWQLQPFVGYAHEVSLPLLKSQHMTAILNESDRIVPLGSYVNLPELWSKIKDQTSPPELADETSAEMQTISSFDVRSAIKRVLCATFWTTCADVKGIVEQARESYSLSDEEIHFYLGWTPDEIEKCPVWKLTAAATEAGVSESYDPDVLIQAIPTPYDFSDSDMPINYPLVGSQCINFLDRTVGLGYGQISYYVQQAINTLMTLLTDNVIRNSQDIKVVNRSLLANLPAQLDLKHAGILELKAGVPPLDVKQIIQRLDMGPKDWNVSALFMDRLYDIARRMTGTVSAPFGGRRTATEVVKATDETTRGLQMEAGANILNARHQFAIIQKSNNMRFLDHEDAIRLAGAKGLKVSMLVQSYFDSTQSPITTYPVRIRVVGRNRISDRLTQVTRLNELLRSPLGTYWVQAKASGAPFPAELENMWSDMLEGVGLENPSRYLRPGSQVLTTQDVIRLLQLGHPVDVDKTRFETPEALMQELLAVQQFAEQSKSQLASYYAMKLWDLLQQWVAMLQAYQAAMGQAQMAAGGNGGNGNGNGNGKKGKGKEAFGRASQMAMPTMMPTGATGESDLALLNAIPNFPGVGEGGTSEQAVPSGAGELY